jgi:hypothetical protein
MTEVVERYLAELKKHGYILDYRLQDDGDGTYVIISQVPPLPPLRRITIDSEKYKAQIEAI